MKLRLYVVVIIIIISLISYFVYRRYNITYKDTKDDNTYLFWTGGFDSTFRLCELLIIEKKQVVPIYITYPYLDNKIGSKYKRNSSVNEIHAMETIKKQLFKEYPFTKINLKKTMYIDYLELDSVIKTKMRNLWKRKLNYRPITQCGGLAQVSKNLKIDIEMSVEDSPHSKMRKIVMPYIGTYKDKIRIIKYDRDIQIFKNLIFPLIYVSKKKMIKIAKINNFYSILNLTWSCWFPKNDKACGKCSMCRSRII